MFSSDRFKGVASIDVEEPETKMVKTNCADRIADHLVLILVYQNLTPLLFVLAHYFDCGLDSIYQVYRSSKQGKYALLLRVSQC